MYSLEHEAESLETGKAGTSTFQALATNILRWKKGECGPGHGE